LNAEERDHLIAALFSSTEPNLTPEGKTILTILTDEELSRRFG
jgi:DNA mismatch repair protein MutL